MAESAFQSLRDLDLSRDEIERFTDALKDEEFRKLFVDYVEEIQDPENKKIYEKEIAQLELERGNIVTFINPTSGYVIKTSVDGCKKCFVNICSSEHVKKPTSTPTSQEGSKGLRWSLPHSISPPRDDLDNKKVRCQVFDVVFHPDTLHLARNNTAFRNMVNKTALEAIEANFDVKLDVKNLKFPKLQYKGMPQSTVIRKPTGQPIPEKSPEEQVILDKLFESMPKTESPKRPKKCSKSSSDYGDYTTPKYVIKHRSHIELEEFTYDRSAKMNAAIPKELVVEINLPLLKSAGDIVLDVTEKSVQLTSEKPAKYKLLITLPYCVNQDGGNAKFDKDLKKLIVTLPVKRQSFNVNEDSGVESDPGSPISSPPTEAISLIQEIQQEETPRFLDANVQYNLPEYTCHISDDVLTFTLQVKNVNESTVEKQFNDVATSLHVKFSSVSSGFFPIHYAFYVRLPEHFIDTNQVSIEAWDNNVVVQIAFKPCDKPISTYLVGTNNDHTIQKNTESKHESADEETEEKQPVTIYAKPREVQKANVVLDTVALKDEPRTTAIDIVGACSESSGDELSYSYSPSKCKGILKRISSSRSSVSRSISESSIDDLVWTSSFENCYNSMDSVIPEDGEVSASLKKTVRFNDNVTRQLFRSNSSILGQKKKNQRKARNKKRAQERRHSESELSESEDKRERDLKTTQSDEGKADSEDGDSEKKEDNHIFDFDM